MFYLHANHATVQQRVVLFLCCHTCSALRLESNIAEGIFTKPYLTTPCGYQPYSSCWNILASEWGWRGGSRTSRGSRFVPVIYLSGVCTSTAHRAPAVWLCRLDVSASCSAEHHQRPLTLQNHYPSALLHGGYLRTSQIQTQTCMSVNTVLGGNAGGIQTPLWFNSGRHNCRCVHFTKATVFFNANHLKWTTKSHYNCVVQESMAALSRIRKSNGGCFSVRLNSSGGPCAD